MKNLKPHKFYMVFSINDSDLQRLELDKYSKSGAINLTTLSSVTKESESQPDLVWDPEEKPTNEQAETKDVVDKDIVISHNWQRKYLKRSSFTWRYTNSIRTNSRRK